MKDVENTILKILKDSEQSLSIKELTETIISEKGNGYSRPTISKYVSILEAKGRVNIREVGRVKLVSYKEI